MKSSKGLRCVSIIIIFTHHKVSSIPVGPQPDVVDVAALAHQEQTTSQTQNICITFVQHRPNVFEAGPTLRGRSIDNRF